MGQLAVGDLDRIEGGAGNLGRDRGNGGDGMAVIQHLGDGKAVFLNVAQEIIVLRQKVGPGDHGLDAGHGLGCRSVDGENFGMGVG